MRLSFGVAYLALASQSVSAVSLPESHNALDILERDARSSPRSSEVFAPDHTLERRKGGGGRGGGSSSSSSGGSSSGGSRSSGSSGAAPARAGGTSNVGGQTVSGSGPTRGYGGGNYYGGGAAVPYRAGSNTPKKLLAGALILPAAALLIMPGLWLYSVYPYHYNNPYRFYNRSAVNESNPNGVNQTLPVTCLCQEFQSCGCDENSDQKYIDDLIGNGSYAGLNKSLVNVADVNGTRNLVLNGSLPNGTTAPGGSDDAAVSLSVGKYAGYWIMGLMVVYGVLL